jgi:hypothetical protein
LVHLVVPSPSRCPVIAAIVTLLSSAAPALLRWSRFAHPGVIARTGFDVDVGH